MRAVVPCCRVCSCCLGGIATIGLRHAGDTPSWGFYGSKTPRWALGCAVGCWCCAQRAVHLGRMRRKGGVWGEVDDVVSVGSRCWGRAVGPRQCGRLRQCGRPGWRRGCEGWLPASSCPVPVFGLVVWGGITTIGVRHAGDTPSRGFYGSKTPRCAAGLCGGWSVLCSTCSPPRLHEPIARHLGRGGLRFGRGFAVQANARGSGGAPSRVGVRRSG